MSGEYVGQRGGFRRWTAALIVLCAASLWLQFTHIDNTLPYPLDTDEPFITAPASHTLLTGKWHPGTFNYPSLPKYLATAGMVVGFFRSAEHLETRDIHDLGDVGYPYYHLPRVVQGARQLFVLLAVIALAATGIVAWHALQRPSVIFVAPLLLALSPTFFYQSWTYLNVDIVGLCFSTLTLAACLQGTRRPSFVQSAIIPGVLAGLATGSKYTLALVILPVLLAIGLYLNRGRRIWACLAALALMGVTFLVVVPYSLIDFPNFLSGVAFEVFHYARGHVGYEADPGLPQALFYGRLFVDEFGAAAMAATIIGAVALAFEDWRRAAVLFAFPIAMMGMLISQRVHFERNTLSVLPVIAVMAAYGLAVTYAWIATRLRQRQPRSSVAWRVVAAAGLALVAVVIPWWRIPAQIRNRTDSRKRAVAWMIDRVPADWSVLVPTQLRFDGRDLEKRGSHVVEVDLQTATDVDAFDRALGTVHGPAVVLLPHWGADERYPGQQLADTLNRLSSGLKPLRTFGTNPVLVNYAEPAPWGDPQFGIATLGRSLGGHSYDP